MKEDEKPIVVGGMDVENPADAENPADVENPPVAENPPFVDQKGEGREPSLTPGRGSSLTPGKGSSLTPGRGSSLTPGKGSSLRPPEDDPPQDDAPQQEEVDKPDADDPVTKAAVAAALSVIEGVPTREEFQSSIDSVQEDMVENLYNLPGEGRFLSKGEHGDLVWENVDGGGEGGGGEGGSFNGEVYRPNGTKLTGLNDGTKPWIKFNLQTPSITEEVGPPGSPWGNNEVWRKKSDFAGAIYF